jgi:hypothetical protein
MKGLTLLSLHRYIPSLLVLLSGDKNQYDPGPAMMMSTAGGAAVINYYCILERYWVCVKSVYTLPRVAVD